MDQRLQDAIMDAELATVKEIITQGDLSAIDDEGRSALHLAVIYDAAEVARELLESGADPNQQQVPQGFDDTDNQWTPLHYACKAGSLEMAEISYMLVGGDFPLAIRRFGNEFLPIIQRHKVNIALYMNIQGNKHEE